MSEDKKTVLVTGSSRGIGRAIALRLAHDGYNVVVHCREQLQAAEQVLAELVALGAQARLLQFDIADRKAAKTALLADIEAHGIYYGVVCNAGVTRDGAFPALSGEDWDQVLHTPTSMGFLMYSIRSSCRWCGVARRDAS